MSRRFRTHYDNLKVSRDAPPEVIRSAYKALVNKYHPDRNHGSERALKAMQAINVSFEVLNDPVRRKAHDEWIDRKTGQTASNPYTAPRPTPQPEPFRPAPQQEPTHTYTPPPNPTLEWQLGCFRWIIGLLILGLIGGVLEMCSDKPRRSSYRPPTPTPTPAPTPTPLLVPVKPVEPIRAPFGMQWGETPERVKAVVQRAGAKVVAEGRQDHERVVVVDGIQNPALRRTTFRFVDDALREVSLLHGASTWSSGSQMLEKWIGEANESHGEGYRFKNIDAEAAGIRKRVEGWAWVQDTGSLRIVLNNHEVEGKETTHVTLTRSSAEFPPHETVVFATEKQGLAPFKIDTEPGANYLLKLVDPQTRKDVMRMFVVGGQQANFWAPLGEYELVYAAGRHWYGDELLFGPQTQYAKADTVSRFTSAISSAEAAKLPNLERKIESASKALRDYMTRNKFSKQTIDYIFDGRDPKDNLKGPGRLSTEWWMDNVLNKIGKKPKLYNGLVDRLNAFKKASNDIRQLNIDAGGYNGVSLTLYGVRGGNLETPPITPEEFFGSEGAATP